MARNIYFYITIIALSLGVVGFFFKGLVFAGTGSEGDPYTVCAEECDFTSIGDAFGFIASGDFVLVTESYHASADYGNWGMTIPAGVTLMCQSHAVTIAPHPDDISPLLNFGDNSTISGCTIDGSQAESDGAEFQLYLGQDVTLADNVIKDFRFSVGLGSTIRDNQITYSRNPDGHFVVFQLSAFDDITIASNSIDVEYGGAHGLTMFVDGQDGEDVELNDLTIASNTIRLDASQILSSAEPVRILGFDYIGDNVSFRGNTVRYINGSEVSNPFGFFSVNGNTSQLEVRHNTFFTSNVSPFNGEYPFMSIGDGHSEGGGGSLDAVVEYNVFYNEVGDFSDYTAAIEFRTFHSDSQLVEDYNGFAGTWSPEDPILGTSGDEGVSITSGGHSQIIIGVSPLRDANVDDTDDFELSPMSSFIDVNGTEDIGAIPATRGSVFVVDDDGIIDYATVHATSTFAISMYAQSGDTWYLRGGVYDPFRLADTPWLQSGISIVGSEVLTTTTYQATHMVFEYEEQVYDGFSNTLILRDLTCDDVHMYSTDGEDVTSDVEGEDWHVALLHGGEGEGEYFLSALVPGQVTNEGTDIDCNEINSVYFIPSVFVFSGDEFTFDADALSSAGVTVADGYTNPPAIESVEVGLSGATIIQGASDYTFGIEVEDISNVSLSNLEIRNASTTLSGFYASHMIFDYNEHTYDDSEIIDEESTQNATFILSDGGGCDITSYSEDDVDVTRIVTPGSDWHLALASIMNMVFVTILVPDQFASSGPELVSLCDGEIDIDQFVSSAFTYDDGAFVYNSGAIASAGITVADGYTNPPYIERVDQASAGLRLIDTGAVTIENMNLLHNSIGIEILSSDGSVTVNTSTIQYSTSMDVVAETDVAHTFNNTTFNPASSTVSGTGSVVANFTAQAFVQNEANDPISGAGVAFITDQGAVSDTVTTTADGYTPYTSLLTAFVLSSGDAGATAGGYNPYTAAVEAMGPYASTTASHNLISINQLFILTLTESVDPPLDAPTDIHAEQVSTSSVRIVWTDASDDETGFEFEYVAGVDDSAFPGVTSSLAVNVTSTEITGLTPNTAYVFRVRAVNDTSVSAYAVSDAIATHPETPTDLEAETTGEATILLTWSGLSNPHTTIYEVYNVTDESTVTTTTAVSTTVSGLTPNTQYQFRVRAQFLEDPEEYTSYSADSEAVYTHAAVAVVPTVTAVSSTALQISIGEDGNPSDTKYAIYNYTDQTYLVADGSSDALPHFLTIVDWGGSVATGLSVNSAYQFAIIARNGDDIAAATSTESGAVYTHAQIPGTIDFSNVSTSSVTVSWLANGNPEGTVYELRLDDDSLLVSTSDLSYHHTGLEEQTQYIYKVRAQNGDDEYTNYTATQSVNTLLSLPTMPASPEFDAITTSSLTAVWVDTSDNESGFILNYVQGTDPEQFNGTTLGIDANVTSRVLLDLMPNTPYMFRIASVNETGTSAYATSSVGYTNPVVPGVPEVTAIGTSTLTVSWDAHDNGAGTVYEVYNVTDDTVVATTTNVSIEVSGLTPNMGYQFQVRAQYLSDTQLSTDYSAESGPIYTLAVVPVAPTVSAASDTAVDISIEPDGNASGTLYALYNVTDEIYIAADGTSNGAVPVYQTTSSWYGISAAGLVPNSPYTFALIARNGDGKNTATSTNSLTVYTDAAQPGVPSIDAVTVSSATVSWTANGNPAGTVYEIFNVTDNISVSTTTDTEVNVTGLAPNIAYEFRVRAQYQGDSNTYTSYSASSDAVYTYAEVPSVPSFAAISTSSVEISWFANGNPPGTTYELRLDDDTLVVLTTDLTYTHTDLAEGTEYTYKVRATNGDGVDTAYSEVQSVTTLISIPLAPHTATAVDVSTNQFLATWHDSSENETDFVVEYISGTDVADFPGTIIPLAENATSTSITELIPNSPYLFRVAAVNSAGTSTYSTSTVVYTHPEVPGTPTITGIAPTTIDVSWDVNGNPAGTVYELRFENGASITTTTDTSFSVSNLIANTAYAFQVRAQYLSDSDVYTAYSGGSDDVYTYANIVGGPSVNVLSSTALSISIINPNGNPSTTLYAIYNDTNKQYLDSNGEDSGDTPLYQSASDWDELSTTGRTPNTMYRFALIPQNGDGVNAATSTLSDSVYTHAAIPGVPTFSNITANSITVSWNANNNPTGTEYELRLDDNTLIETTTDTSYLHTGLDEDTTYQYKVRAKNNDNVYTSYSETHSTTTLDIPPTAPSNVMAGVVTTGSIAIHWDDTSDNETEFSVEYIQGTDEHAFLEGGVVTSTPPNATSTIVSGLAPNTPYLFRVAALNNVGTSTYSTSTVVYTDATVPGVPTAVATGVSTLSVSWGANGNPAGTVYRLYNVTLDTNVATTTATTVSVVGLAPNTAYVFKVQAQHHADVATYTDYSDLSVSVATNDEEQSPPSNDGSSSTVLPPPPPSFAGDIDKAVAFRINGGAIATGSTLVQAMFEGVTNATHVAISNVSDFVGASFVPFVSTIDHVLTAGNGIKTVYAKLRSLAGGTITLSDTIILTGQSFDDVESSVPTDLSPTDIERIVNCPVVPGSAIKTVDNNTVYYITAQCTKLRIPNSTRYFTYFTSWDDVNVVTQSAVDAVLSEPTGVSPLGPRYAPQYGALVKQPSDPKVYVILNNVKYWFADETVFTMLGYEWHWIEDVDPRFLDKYETGGEITDTTRHPNYSIVKYPDDVRVYRLEPDPNDPSQTIKRWIPNEAIFNSFNFRWDRILILPTSAVYPDGANLEAE